MPNFTTPVKQNDVSGLSKLTSFRYENFFNLYQDGDDRYFYNLLSKINFPENTDNTYYTVYSVPSDYLPYTYISYKLYGTIHLWWLICAYNQIINPVEFPKAGTQLKILKPEYVRGVLQTITNQ